MKIKGEEHMNKIQTATLRLAQASDGNPVTTTLTVILFYVLINMLFYVIEKLFFGGQFVHVFDVFLAMAAIAYSTYAVYWCAIYNSTKE
jgi:hypothetical protein